MDFVIDRFEGDAALCEKENGDIVTLPREFLPENAAEGDVLRNEGDEDLIIALCPEEKQERLTANKQRLSALFSKE